MFTLIHQNLIAILASHSNQLCNDTTLNQASLPELLKSMSNNVKTFERLIHNKVFRTGVEIGSEEITIKYNIPLQFHSAAMWFKYDTLSKETMLKCSLLGLGRGRWSIGARALKLVDKLKELSLAEPIQMGEQELIFSWKIKDMQTNKIAMGKWRALIEMSLSVFPETEKLTKVVMHNKEITKATVDEFYKLTLKEKEISPADERVIDMHKISLNLFKKLVDRGEVVEEAIAAAEKGAADVNASIRQEALNLFESLVENRHCYKEALKAAKDEMTEETNRRKALSLFNTLAKQGQGLEEAAVALNIGLADENKGIRHFAEILSKTLQKG
jgi:hypothetical protein